jgi:trimethylamine--corrinoid protein Co-methyltransferase
MPSILPIRSQLKLEVLSAEALAEIKSATLQVMERVGVRFPSPKALQVFADHGADIEHDTGIVKLPGDLVLNAMRRAPRAYALAGRGEDTNLTLDGAASYFGTDGCGVETVDFSTGARRRSRKADVAQMARVADYLSSIAFYWPMVSAQDYGITAPLHELDASFNNTVKHVQTETVMGEKPARYALRMAEVIAGDGATLRARPPLSSLICTIAPLGQDREGIEAAMVFAKAGIPVGFMGMPTMGSTAPAAAAGALVVANAEVVSAMTLMQLVAPGAPVFHSILVSAMDPHSGSYIVGHPEKYLANAAQVQIAHDWGVPALAGSFGLEASEPGTWQLGRDSVYTALLCALAGTDITIGLGMLGASTLLVPEQILFDDEIYHTHRLLAEGLHVERDALALDVIAAVGPGGHFLAQKHTRRQIREMWIPELSHPRPSPEGRTPADIRLRARAKLERILTEHKPEPLDRTARAELQKILKAAKEELSP